MEVDKQRLLSLHTADRSLGLWVRSCIVIGVKLMIFSNSVGWVDDYCL